MCRLRQGVPGARSSPAAASVRLFHGPYRVRSNWSRPSWYSSPREWRVSQRGDCACGPVVPSAVHGHVPAEVGEGAPGHLGRDAALAVVRARVGQRRHEHVDGKAALEGSGGPVELGQDDRVVGPAHVPDEFVDGVFQEPPQLRVVHDPSAHPHEFVDVLVRYGQFHQHLGQFVGIRKHAVTPSSALWSASVPKSTLQRRGGDPDAYRQ